MLDPLADKVLSVSIYVSLGILSVLPRWLVILVVFRDLMIVGAILLSWVMAPAGHDRPARDLQDQYGRADRPRRLRPLHQGLRRRDARTVLVASFAVAALTAASTAAYVRQWLRHMTS